MGTISRRASVSRSGAIRRSGISCLLDMLEIRRLAMGMVLVQGQEQGLEEEEGKGLGVEEIDWLLRTIGSLEGLDRREIPLSLEGSDPAVPLPRPRPSSVVGHWLAHENLKRLAIEESDEYYVFCICIFLQFFRC